MPVTEATYWSDTVGEAAHDRVHVAAFNHSRAQILAPHKEVDPWAGLDPAGGRAARSRTSGGARRGGAGTRRATWLEAARGTTRRLAGAGDAADALTDALCSG